MINAGENTARLAKWLTVSSSPRPKNQSPLGVGGRKGGNTSRKPTRGEQLATRREEKGVCSMLFPPEGAAPPNSSPKRGLTCMHSPSPPDPRWSRRIACVSPPPTSVVCSASPPPPPPRPRRGCRGLRQRPAGEHRLSPARSAGSGSRWMAKIHFSRYKMGEAVRSLSQGLLLCTPPPHPVTRCRLPLPPPPPAKPGAMHIILHQASNQARCK